MLSKVFRPRRNLGQNFLCDTAVVRRIVVALKLQPEDVILEIGCGTGALTRELAGRTRQFIGIELDTRLFHTLSETYSGSNIIFVNEDILSLEFDWIRSRYLASGEKLNVIGNLPYYLTSPILMLLARHAPMLKLAVVMLQAEVADRVVSEPGSKEYGILSLTVQYYFEARQLFSVHPRAFRPAPEVLSKVVELVPRGSRLLSPEYELAFFRFVKQSFAQRRKTLRNAFRNSKWLRAENLPEILEELGYPSDVRAERISLPDFVRLFRRLRQVPD